MIYSIIEVKPFVAGLFYRNHSILCCYVINPTSGKTHLIIKFSEATESLDYLRYDLIVYKSHCVGNKLLYYEKVKEYKLNFLSRNEFADIAISEIYKSLRIESKPKIYEINESRLSFFMKLFNDFTYMPETDIIQKIYVSEKSFKSLVSKERIIDIAFELLEEFPISLLMKTETEKIDMRGNQFENLPDKFAEFKQLQFLDISENLFFQFPEVITKIKRLEHLVFRGNFFIKEIPNSIKELSNLRELELNLCNLRNLPESIVELKKIKKLVIDETAMYEIPDFISELVTLEELHIINNRELKVLPESIFKLKNLTHLYLYGNQLSSLPNSIGELIKLKVLDIESNNLKELPPTISELHSLQKLVVANNKLTKFPYKLLDIPFLKSIVIEGNPKIDKNRILQELNKREKKDRIKIRFSSDSPGK